MHYLLKPVEFDKFLEAISRVTKRLNFSAHANTPLYAPGNIANHRPSRKILYFLIKEDKKLIRVAPDNIVFVEGMKNYLKMHPLRVCW